MKAIISKNKQKIYTGIYDLIGDAERLYSKGPEKFDYVFKNAYYKVPKVLRILISEDDIRRAIEYYLNKLQAYATIQNKAITKEATSILVLLMNMHISI